VAQAHLTHNHPLSDAACITTGRMVQAALFGADRFALHALARDLVTRFPPFRFNDYHGRASGYVVETMQTVFHFLFTTGSFEECLVEVVNQGGDADTTGAIAGMIAGALYGEAAIPEQWLKRLEPSVRTNVKEAAEALVRRSPYFNFSGTGDKS
jgi:ADP-ribosyl-[dinitrogen reductase] hydrolase